MGHLGGTQGRAVCSVIVVFLLFLNADVTPLPVTKINGRMAYLSPTETPPSFANATAENAPDKRCLDSNTAESSKISVVSAMVRKCVSTDSFAHGACPRNTVYGWADNGTRVTSQFYAAHHKDKCIRRCGVGTCNAVYDRRSLLCPSSLVECQFSRHFASLEATYAACADGWYGDECEVLCPCNGHGRCDRYKGTCTCYADRERGYWDGSDCSKCSSTFLGENCTGTNTLFTELEDAELDIRFQNEDSVDGHKKPEDTIVVEWGRDGPLVLGKGNNIVCGVVDITTPSDTQGGENVKLSSAAVFQHVPYTVRDMRLLANGTIVVLTAGVHAGTPSDFALGVAVWHVSPVPQDDSCIFAQVQNTVLDFSVMGNIVDAHVSETLGWALLLSSGTVVLEKRLGKVLTLPSHFSAKSLQIDGNTGLVLIAGVDKLSWGLYATHTTESGSPLYAVHVLAPTAVINMKSIAWRVATVGDRVQIVGTAQGRVWGATGQLAYSDSSISKATGATFSVEAFGEVPLPGIVRALSLSTPTDKVASTVLAFVQTEASLWSVVWVNDRVSESFRATTPELLSVPSPLLYAASEKKSTLTLRNLQSFTTATSASLPPARMLVVSNGLLLLCRPFSFSAGTGVYLVPYTGYGVTSVSPSAVDNAGGTEVTVQGIGFRDGMDCIFDKNTRVASILISSTALRCEAPPQVEFFACTSSSVEVADGFPFKAITQSGVTLERISTPSVSAAFGQDTTGPYAFITSTAPVVLIGQWFLNTTELRCLFKDEMGRYETQGHYITSQQLTCDPPKGLSRPTKGSTGTVAVSLDGGVFSVPVAFTFIGFASRLAVAASTPAIIEVRSAAFVELPSIMLQVVDSEGHPLRELDNGVVDSSSRENNSSDEGRVVRLIAPWLNSTRKEVGNPLDPSSSLVVLAFSNKTVQGAASFSVYLQYPLASVGALEFMSEGLGSVQILYTVAAGNPQSMAIAVQPAPLLSARYVDVSRQPIIVFKDAAGNTVSDWALIHAYTGGYVRAVYFNGSDTVECLSDPVAESGLVFFSNLQPLGLFGQSFTVTFSVERYSSVSSNLMAMSDCRPDEYGQYNTTLCLPCLLHTSCNGSYEVNVTDGYWKGGALVYGVYPCPRPRVCRGGRCTTGYTGLLCSVCSAGYGLTGSECVRCFSTVVNIVIVTLLIVCVLLCVFCLTFAAFQVLGPFGNVVHCVQATLNFAQLVSLVVLPLPELPEYVQQFTVFTRLFSMGDVLRLSPFSCLLRLDARSRFAIESVAVAAVSLLLQVASMYANVVIEKHWMRLRRRQSFLRLLAPFTSEEAYCNRLTDLGLDDEHALAQVAVTETSNPRQRRLRNAYALLDKNRNAITAVGQLPHSTVREAAMRSLFGERAELQHFLEHYETHVSCGGGHTTLTQSSPNDSATDAASLPPPLGADIHFKDPAIQPPASDEGTRVEAGHTDRGGSNVSPGGAGAIISKENWNSFGGLGDLPQGEPRKEHSFGKSGGGGGGMGIDRVLSLGEAQRRFDGITATPFDLFGSQEVFRPTPVPLHPIILQQLTPMRGEEHAAPVRDTAATSPSFLWPPLKAQIITYAFTVYHYFYATVLEYCFALMQCDEKIVSAAVEQNSAASGVIVPSSFSYVSLVADRSVDCHSSTYGAYRLSAAVFGSVFAVAGPLLLVCLSVWQPSTAHGGFLGYTRECCLTLYALRDDYLWWEAFLLACKLLLVVYRTLIPDLHLSGLFVFWTISAVLGLTVSLRPFYDYMSQSLHAIASLVLCVVAGLQLLPWFCHASVLGETGGAPFGLSATQHVSGSLVVVLSCLTLALMIYLAWTSIFPRYRWQLFDSALHHLGSSAESTGRRASGQENAPLFFTRYNINLVQQAHRGYTTAESDDDEGGIADLELQIVRTVRGKASTKTGRRSSASWVNWGMVGGVVGIASHVHLFFCFIDENEVRAPTDVVAATKTLPTGTTPEASEQSPLHILEEEVADELASLSEHLRQLERFVQLMEKAVERRTTSG